MIYLPESGQRFTATDTEVIRQARQRRTDMLILRRDRPWLLKISPDPTALLGRMARRGALIRLGGGRYAIPEVGSTSLATSTPWESAVDAELGPLGAYYVGFITALEGHRLTDLDENEISVAIGFHNDRIERGRVRIRGRELRVTTAASDLFDFGIETVHLSRDRRYRRSDIERTLIDCHERPRMVRSNEAWIRAWAEALRTERADIERLLDYSLKVSSSAARRTALLLSLLGHGEQARDALPGRVRRADRTVPLIAGEAIGDADEIDPYWRVAFNLPRDLVEGWLAYGR